MAGMRGNVAWFAGTKQTAKGTAAAIAVPAAGTAGTYKMPFSGGTVGPVRSMDRLSETDSSRDQGVSYVTTSGVEGSPEVYVRDASIGALLTWALGADAVTGTAPNFTHVITPANALPYITFNKDIGDTLFEQYKDCKVGSLGISADAGAPLVATLGINGLSSTRLATDPTTTPAIPMTNGAVYTYNDATVTLGGVATALVRSFDLGIENNLTRQQTDAVEAYDVYEGTREVTIGFDLYFETLTEYNNFHYASQAAAAPVSPNVYTTSCAFSFDKGANNSVAFNLPSIAYEEFPVEPSAGGDSVVVSVRASAQRSGSPIITATVKNQVAVY